MFAGRQNAPDPVMGRDTDVTKDDGMKKHVFAAGLMLALSMVAAPARADDLVESYSAGLSEADHFNSNGQRLTSPAAIIRQDRANFHRFGVRDPDDEGDSFFSSQENRALMERLIERGRISASARKRIVNGTPYVTVEIYAGPGGDYVNIEVDRGDGSAALTPPHSRRRSA